MLTTDAFREHVETFLKSAGISASRFGKEAVGDPNFVSDLREGRSPSLTLVNRVLAFIADHPTKASAA